MKLKRLVLIGFIRFKDTVEIEFPQEQVTLISGENGAGKTSILDSICICLYGKTLRTAGQIKSGYLRLPDLVNHQSERAAIKLEFENFGHNYVVTREISKSGKTRGELLEDGVKKAEGRFVYEYVKRVAVGLDWEGFTKSTVVLQGEMGALTEADPSERKLVFKKLFGLERYLQYGELAHQKIRSKEEAKKITDEAIRVLQEEVRKLPQVKKEIRNLKEKIAGLVKELESLTAIAKMKKIANESLEVKHRRYGVLKERRSGLERQFIGVQKQVDEKEGEKRELEGLKTQLPELEKSYKQLERLGSRLDGLESLKSKYDDECGKLSKLNVELSEKQDTLKTLDNDINEEKRRVRELRKIVPSKEKVEKAKREFENVLNRVTSIERREASLTTEIRTIDKSVKGLRGKQTQVKGKDKCPVCLQPIASPDEIVKHYEGEIREFVGRKKKRSRELNRVRLQLRTAIRHQDQTKQKKEGLVKAFAKSKVIETRIETLRRLKERKSNAKRNINSINNKIKTQRKTIASIGFRPRLYERIYNAVTQLKRAKVIERYKEAQTQVKRLPEVRRSLEELLVRKRTWGKKKTKLDDEITAFGDIENQYRTAKQEFERAQKRLNGVRQNLATERANKRNRETYLKELKGKKRQIEENRKKVRQLEKETMLLEELRNIFKTIPENIVRRLRPFIEKEGNDIVNELSNGEITALNIEEETLNVEATVNGERQPIQYFSGGEKTRINMALRVAISRILSRLPQTREHTFAIMQTLFIDEGEFGTLDESGIRESVNVIKRLTKEFNRVVLISHVDMIKEIFQGYTINVIKTGSEESKVRSFGKQAVEIEA